MSSIESISFLRHAMVDALVVAQQNRPRTLKPGDLPPLKGTVELTDPEIEALYALAHGCYVARDWAQARTWFELMTMARPLERRAHLALAACHAMEHHHAEALGAYITAACIDPADPATVLHIAECLLRLERPVEAREALADLAGMAALDGRQTAHLARLQQWLATADAPADPAPPGPATAHPDLSGA